MLLMIDKKHRYPAASNLVHTLSLNHKFPSIHPSNSNQHRILQSR